jgi:uncharacterized protein with NAD-binding domain and iron-sulfur cluster
VAEAKRKPRVVILGGGVAGMTAAMELSRPGWREKFESITVYQYGWRLGGKGASGRGPRGRIEEHGLHIWLGFYENAFRLMHECYDELARDESSPICSIEQAFERASLFIVQEPRGDGWLPWIAEFPEYNEMPGQDAASLPSLWDLVVRGLRLALTYNADAASPDLFQASEVSLHPVVPAESSTVSLAPADQPPATVLASHVEALYGKVRRWVSELRQLELALALELAEQLPRDASEHDPAHHDRIVGLLDRAGDRLRETREDPDDESDQARRDWYLTDILIATVRGLLADGVLRHPDGLDSIDQYDFAEWLIRHGASPESARCGLVTTIMYDLPFSYRDGNPRKPANAAGTALRGALQLLFTYKGAIAWKMRAGMGDIVFAPMFEVLDRRGVRFEFFHRVDALRPSRDGKRVGSIAMTVQAEVKKEAEPYWPLVRVKDLPCWPSEPLTEKLVEPVSAKDLESFWSTAKGSRVTLRAGRDFETVVLAIPVGAHPYVCERLLPHNPRWADMVKNLGTIYTQAFQLWLNHGLEDLGCDRPPATSGGYLEPFDTYADMQQLIEREDWRAGRVKSIAYFCNVLQTPTELPSPNDHDLPTRYSDQVKANALAFLSEAMAPLWPGGVDRYPTEFRWKLLVDDHDRDGEERFDSQFWRANVDPSERYVQSLPGTSKYRLAPDQSGFENLVFAGDWTRCGLNNGCVEAAVVSGLLAAAAVERRPPRRPIIGYREQGARHVL